MSYQTTSPHLNPDGSKKPSKKGRPQQLAIGQDPEKFRRVAEMHHALDPKGEKWVRARVSIERFQSNSRITVLMVNGKDERREVSRIVPFTSFTALLCDLLEWYDPPMP